MKIRNHAWCGLVAMIFLIPLGAFGATVEASQEDLGFHDESEAGIVVTTGNTRSSTYNLKQKNTYGWGGSHLLKFEGNYLSASTLGNETARSYVLGLRYEEKVSEKFSVYLAQSLESDVFAGYLQRHNSDLGGRYQLIKADGLLWNAEAGYRYTVENRTSGDQSLKSFARAYTDVAKDINRNVSAKLSVEYLPNLSSLSDYRLNSELSLTALLSQIFSIKTGYLVKYINQPLPGITVTADSIFTTALVAKY